MPDFNLVKLLQLIHSQINQQTIEHYVRETFLCTAKRFALKISLLLLFQAFSIRYPSSALSQESDFDVFTQLNTLKGMQDCNPIALYTLDFVEHLFQAYHFQIFNILIILRDAKQVSDIPLWFTLDNEVNYSKRTLFLF